MARQTNADDIEETCKRVFMDDHELGGVDCSGDEDDEGGVDYGGDEDDHGNDSDDDDNGGWMEDHDSDWMQHHLLNSNCLII